MRNLILILKSLLAQLLLINEETRRNEAGSWRSSLSLQQGKVFALDVLAKNIEQVAEGHLEEFYQYRRYSLEDVTIRREQLRLQMEKILAEVAAHEGLSDEIRDDLIGKIKVYDLGTGAEIF